MHEIIARFKMDFPNGDYWTYDENKFEEYLSKNFSYDKNHTRLFMHNFRHYLLFPGSLKFFGEITVAVYYSSHNKPIVFVFPVSKEKKVAILQWKIQIYVWNLQNISSVNSLVITR